jgi:hypothetical protein
MNKIIILNETGKLLYCTYSSHLRAEEIAVYTLQLQLPSTIYNSMAIDCRLLYNLQLHGNRLPSKIYNSTAENCCLQPAKLQLENDAKNPAHQQKIPAENTAVNSLLSSRKHHLQFPPIQQKIPAENAGGKYRQKIPAENTGGKYRRKIPAENTGGKYRGKYQHKILHLIHIYPVSV